MKPKAVLFDLDGVLYTGDTLIPGALETVSTLRKAGIACRFVTNTSTLSRGSLQSKLQHMGLTLQADELISAPQAALHYIESMKEPVCRLLLAEDVQQDFAHLPQSDTDANVIVVGDIGNAWTYTLLNEVFNSLIAGAQLIAIHKNRFWQTEQGLQMDIGAFIHGLEYASQTKALIIGKPSLAFFQIALQTLGLTAEDVVMVGDDIDSDIGGAQAAGIKGILVKTGKYRASYANASPIVPDAVIDSIGALPRILL